MSGIEPKFSLEDVTFHAGDRSILEPLTLEISLGGRVVALIGHNGSGKSTLLKLLARQHAATNGRTMLNQIEMSKWGDRAFAREVAYLPQHLPSAAGMSVRDLVALGRYPWHGALGRFGRKDREKVDEAMSLTNVAGMADRIVGSLSGGERQRTWLAMLVAQEAKYLLLDEPISALDIAYQIEVLSLVRTLCRSKGLGVIVVLHDINMAARFCDEILALHSGSLIARGSPSELMSSPMLKRIYGIDMAVMTHPGTDRMIASAC